VLPNGTLVNLFTQLDEAAGGQTTATLNVLRSSDKGGSWSGPIRVADMLAIGARDPETATPIRDGAGLAQIAVAPNGLLFAIWQDARFSGGARDGIALSRSIDGGLTWSAPLQINSAPSAQAFTPSVRACQRDDRCHVVRFPFEHRRSRNAADRAHFRALHRRTHVARESFECRVRHGDRTVCARIVHRGLPGADERQ